MGHDHYVAAAGGIGHLDDPETPDGITYSKIKSILLKCLKKQKKAEPLAAPPFFINFTL
jgi:hypothetical protein